MPFCTVPGDPYGREAGRFPKLSSMPPGGDETVGGKVA